MKKLTAIVLAVMLLLSCSALGETLMGGWAVSDSVELTDDLMAVFDKGMEGLLGVDYVPMAYLGSQVVAGTNHCFLCRSTVVYPGAESVLALVYLYEDLTGEVSILEIIPFDIGEMMVEDMIDDEGFSTGPSIGN